RSLHFSPGAVRQTQPDPLPGFPLPADDVADLFEFPRHSFTGGDDLVERVGYLAGKPGLIAGQADREIPQPHSLERVQQLMLIGRAVEVPVAISVWLGIPDSGRALGVPSGTASARDSLGAIHRL